MTFTLNEVDSVVIQTLQDNYIDIAARDSTAVVRRGAWLKDGKFRKSVLAEHGFSAVVTVKKGEDSRSILFDFGFSEHGAAVNAEVLGADLSRIEALVLSHGHVDHFGGSEELIKKINRPGLELVLHPAAFKGSRYARAAQDSKVYFPAINREGLESAGVILREAAGPLMMLDGNLLYLGEVPRRTGFEKGTPNLFFEENGVEKRDPIEDDTAVAAKVKGKGLVVLSGCAHAGIVNTVRYAQELTGIQEVFVVMGGFHLTGSALEPVIAPTIAAMKEINPTYIVPTHCTGRKAVAEFEKAMPEKFLLNMSGTTMVFSA